jgi:hypothetical protein
VYIIVFDCVLELIQRNKKKWGFKTTKNKRKTNTHTLDYYKAVSAKNGNDEKESFLSYRNREEKYLIHDVKCIIKKIII